MDSQFQQLRIKNIAYVFATIQRTELQPELYHLWEGGHSKKQSVLGVRYEEFSGENEEIHAHQGEGWWGLSALPLRV